MSSLSHDVDRLRNIKTLPQIITYFRDELGWPIETTDIEEITFEYEPAELGFNKEEVVSFKESKQIRPLVVDQPWGIFWISFDKKCLPVVMLRRILAHLAIKKRQTARRGDRPAWDLHDLLFIVAYGEENDRAITLAHFWQDPQNPGNLAELKVLGWDGGDTVLHLVDAHKMLTEKLRWPEDTRNINPWREHWASAFTLGHKEVIATTQELEVELARLAIAIRKRANSILSKESERGPLRNLFSVFKKTLIHDLTLEDFADVIAQTISYGLLAARLTSSTKISVQNLIEMMPATNPFLRDLLSSFLSVTGRGGNFDFDELGVQEVVELLNRANVDAVKRDFGNRTRDEDPVIHFYEHFLKAYDPEKKVKRGVFFTPQPVVSYIVRSVHELLQTEFGLDDGLASIITWGEMAERNKDLKIPKDTKPEDHFVTILDPATGTATFLVEVIDVIFNYLKEKWKKQGIPKDQQHSIWNDYVSKHLLPRLFGYELMMAPYVIAHLKIGIKLAETGYKFDSDERARIYLTNALEPPIEQTRMENIIPALAREAKEVNEIKQKQRFTVVIGNPPYAAISSNLAPELRCIVDPYRFVGQEKIRERSQLQFEKNIQDDYIKFIAFSQKKLKEAGYGIFSLITNHSYLDGPTLRGMRWNLLSSFQQSWFLDLHGNANKAEVAPESIFDQNVFEIRQGVAICMMINHPKLQQLSRAYVGELWGDRNFKYNQLSTLTQSQIHWTQIESSPPNYYFIMPDVEECVAEWTKWPSICDLFIKRSTGTETGFDNLLVNFTLEELKHRIQIFSDVSKSRKSLAEEFDFSEGHAASLFQRRKELLAINCDDYRSFQLRAYDYRWALLRKDLLKTNSFNVMCDLQDGEPGLITTRQTKEQFSAFAVKRFCGHKLTSSYDRSYVFPLFTRGKGNLLSSEGTCLDQVLLSKFQFTSEHDNTVGASGREFLLEVFRYVLAVLNAASYAKRFSQRIKRDWPKVPLPGNIELFHELAYLGRELAALNLMESPKLNNFITTYNGPQEPEVGRVNWSGGTVWIDEAPTKKDQPVTHGPIGFRGVPEEVWNFHIGGYQVCEKWLKDRKGRTLSNDDIVHYQKIVVALNETIRLMREIDEVIEKHGGWPGAFKTK